MRRTLTTLAFCAFTALGLGAMAPATQAAAFSAGPAAKIVPTAEKPADLVEVNHRDRHWRGHGRHHRGWDRDRHWRHYDRDRYWRHHRPRSGFFFEFGTDYRYDRPYYARPRYVVPHYVAPRAAYGVSSAHVRWCQARYRSYRAYDNSFQPYHGPRRACVSPYWR